MHGGNMKKSILIMLVTLPLVLSVGCSSTSYQSLRDWDEIQIDPEPEIRKELLVLEKDIRDNRAVIAQKTNHIKALSDKLEEALGTGDESQLQSILLALFARLKQMREGLEMQDDKVEQYQVFLYKSLQNIEREKISNPEHKLSISQVLRMKYELAVLDRLHINLIREQYTELIELTFGIIELYVLWEANDDGHHQLLDDYRQSLEDWGNL